MLFLTFLIEKKAFPKIANNKIDPPIIVLKSIYSQINSQTQKLPNNGSDIDNKANSAPDIVLEPKV